MRTRTERWITMLIAGVMAAISGGALSAGPPDLVWLSGGHNGGFNGVDLSADGSLIASASAGDGTVKVWDTSTGGLLRTINAFYGQALSVAFSPDGAIIAGG